MLIDRWILIDIEGIPKFVGVLQMKLKIIIKLFVKELDISNTFIWHLHVCERFFVLNII